MDYMEKFKCWKEDVFFDAATRAELAALDPKCDAREIEKRFCRELEFGTGGLRGIMGAGTNMMNQYTVGKVTAGLGQYLLKTYGADACRERGVAVGYDTRNNSDFFARVTANVFSNMGIHVYLHAYARPTSQLSYSVTFWKALAGVMLTASHNPKEYNGYKVYDECGCQLVPYQVKQVVPFIDAVTDYREIGFSGNRELITIGDVTDCFVSAVLRQSRLSDKTIKESLHVVYTPLHGTGTVPVQQALRQDGFTQIDMVAEQAVPDGIFSTVVSPNPEDRRALSMGIKKAEQTGADIVLGTDPDSDRVGVAVKTSAGFQLMTGNQIGALLMDFVLENTDLNPYPHPAVVKTVVTSELGAEIAKRKGLAVFSTLTGFKYIGEKIVQFERAKKTGCTANDYDFILGYEESCGYLAGTHAKDKDAVVSGVLICEMAAGLKAKGKTLVDRIHEIYAEYGVYRDALDSFSLEGKDGLEKISSIMRLLRESGSPFSETKQVVDYSVPVVAEPGFGALPPSDVLKYILCDGSWVAVRPSGTEPKIKVYYSIKGPDEGTAEEKLKNAQAAIKGVFLRALDSDPQSQVLRRGDL